MSAIIQQGYVTLNEEEGWPMSNSLLLRNTTKSMAFESLNGSLQDVLRVMPLDTIHNVRCYAVQPAR